MSKTRKAANKTNSPPIDRTLLDSVHCSHCAAHNSRKVGKGTCQLTTGPGKVFLNSTPQTLDIISNRAMKCVFVFTVLFGVLLAADSEQVFYNHASNNIQMFQAALKKYRGEGEYQVRIKFKLILTD